MKINKLVLAVLVVTFVAPSSTTYAQQVVDRAAVEQALGERVASDESARHAIRTLLDRDDVKAMAEGAGLDVRRASSAVSTLEGEGLQRVAARAAAANDLLAGGATTITISLVAILLIIIIVILLAS